MNVRGKLNLFSALLLAFLFIMGFLMFLILGDINSKYQNVKNVVAGGNTYLLTIEKEMNYISRCSRDIFIGGEYNKNMDRIMDSYLSIKDNFNKLKKVSERENYQNIDYAKKHAINFIDKLLEVLEPIEENGKIEFRLAQYDIYKSVATPPAQEARKYFKKVVTAQNSLGEEVTENLDSEISMAKVIIIMGIAVAVLFMVVPFFFIAKHIVSSVKLLDRSLHQTIDLILLKRNRVDLIDESNLKDDEFGLMTRALNQLDHNLVQTREKDMIALGEVSMILDKTAEGHYEYTITSDSASPQIQSLVRAYKKVLESSNVMMNEIKNVLVHYQNDDFRPSINVKLEGVMGEMIQGINDLGNRLSENAIKTLDAGETLQESSSRLVENVNTLNQSSSEQAATIEEASATVEEMTASIQEATKKSQSMQQLSSDARDSSNTGIELAKRTADSMDEINSSTSAITESISIIDQIAFQTNILSLNAAVEAATAGEAGKGFAVVAGEVRNLAARSAEAAKVIKELVEKAQEQTDKGKEISQEMVESFTNLNNKINETSELIQDVSATSTEQQKAIEQINDVMSKLDGMSQKNAHSANEVKEIAVSVSQLADQTVEESQHKKVKR
jgi:methyl-accepting chemotaxis protein